MKEPVLNAALNSVKNVSPQATPSTQIGGLFEHVARPHWGLAVRVSTGAEHETFQFEDGKLRRIGSAYLHLMNEVDCPVDESERSHAAQPPPGSTIACNGPHLPSWRSAHKSGTSST